MIAIIPHGANNVNITLLWVCRTGSYTDSTRQNPTGFSTHFQEFFTPLRPNMVVIEHYACYGGGVEVVRSPSKSPLVIPCCASFD